MIFHKTIRTTIMRIYRSLLLPIGLLAGTIIGAGVFALPYVFSRAGLTLGFFYLIVAFGVSVVAHLFYADVILRTSGAHRFSGYVRIYLGRLAQLFAIWSTIVAAIVVLTIYLILSVRFVHLIAANVATENAIVVFWFLGSLGIFLRLKRLAAIEFFITIGIVAILLALFLFGLPAIGALLSVVRVEQIFFTLLPLAPILFALSGRVAIPQLVRYVRDRHLQTVTQRRVLSRTIIWGTLLPAILYALFILSIVTLSPVVSDDAVTGVAAFLPLWLVRGVGILGLLSLFSSYIVVGRDVYESLMYDMQIRKFLSGILIFFLPLALYLVGADDFIQLVTIAGGVFLALEGVMIVVMWVTLDRRGDQPMLVSRWLGYPFALGAFAVFLIALISAL